MLNSNVQKNVIAFNYTKRVDIHYTGYLVSAPTIAYLDILTDYKPGGGDTQWICAAK